jgi:phosphatidylinositol alpha-1,6-mannosyltransferase
MSVSGASSEGRPLRILVTCFDFPPNVGGIATLGHQLMLALAARDDAAIRLLAPGRAGAEAFDSGSGLDVRRVRMGSSSIGSIVPFAWAIRREIRSWKPDTIVNLLWLPDGVATRLATRGTGIRYSVFAHGVEVLESSVTFRKRLRAMLVPVKRRVFNHAFASFAVSNFTAAKLVECGVSADRIRVVHNGVDVTQFYPSERAPDLVEQYWLEGKRVFLTVSRLHRYKGIDVAIEALALLADDGADVVYLVCGTGPDRDRLERLARERGVADRVVFTGYVAQARLRDHYNLCDTFVLLSRYDRETPDVEGFGIVLLEAAACAKPSIAGRSGGIPDAAGESAWLVDATDRAAVAVAMRASLENVGERERRGRVAEERARTSFGWSAMAARIISELEEAAPASPELADSVLSPS